MQHEPHGRGDDERHLAHAAAQRRDRTLAADRDDEQQHGRHVDGGSPAASSSGSARADAPSRSSEEGEGATQDRAHGEPGGVGRRRAGQPRGESASGSVRWTVSTYQASSGPESRARATPLSAQATTKSSILSAIAIVSSPAMVNRPERARTGRCPMASASPPVGSSSSRVTAP